MKAVVPLIPILIARRLSVSRLMLCFWLAVLGDIRSQEITSLLDHFDLTNSMGIPGQFEHPDFLAAVDRLIAACRAHGKPAGVLAGSIEAAESWRARGFRVFAYGTDISLLQQSLRDGLVRLRTGEGR